MRPILWFVALSVIGASCYAQEGQENEATDATVEVTDAAEDEFKVPDGSADELLAFIERVSRPERQFTSSEEVRTYRSQAATAISEAADKILAGEARDEQLVDALQWKVAALGIKKQLGDRAAEKQTEEFLARMAEDARPAIVSALPQLRLMQMLERWNRLESAQRKAALEQYVADVKAAGLTREHAQMLMQLDGMLGDTPDSPLAGETIEALLPLFHKSDDPALAEYGTMLEGVVRRLKLPGNKIELEGKLLDGAPLDWESYRGKVVLVDYWATWCGPCRAEVPNIIENYEAYKEKGFEVLGISLDEDSEQAAKYMDEAGMDWPTLFSDDPKNTGWNHPMADKYAITGIPRAILVDQDGVVVSMMARGPRLRAELEKLLGEPSVVETASRELKAAAGPALSEPK